MPGVLRDTGLVALANRKVAFPLACRLAGLGIPDALRDSGTKLHCPWGEVAHSDGGIEPAFRVWPDHGWCFSCRERFTPVSITARIWEVVPEQAAIRLLEAIGWRPPDYLQAWRRAAAPPALDCEAVAQALRNYCASIAPATALTEPRPAEYLSRCLGYLTGVKSEAEAASWLALAKDVMARVLRGGTDGDQA